MDYDSQVNTLMWKADSTTIFIATTTLTLGDSFKVMLLEFKAA